MFGRELTRTVVAGRRYLHSPTTFSQANESALPVLCGTVDELLGPENGGRLMDLYCGYGASLRAWTEAGSVALGVELAGEAVELCSENAPRAAVLRGTCVQRLPQVHAWWKGHDGERVAYVNPPRSGLEPEVVAALAGELRPARLAYLSCSAGTLRRDLAAFCAAGFAVSAILPFDFFPLTHHVETLALLEAARTRPVCAP